MRLEESGVQTGRKITSCDRSYSYTLPSLPINPFKMAVRQGLGEPCSVLLDVIPDLVVTRGSTHFKLPIDHAVVHDVERQPCRPHVPGPVRREHHGRHCDCGLPPSNNVNINH